MNRGGSDGPGELAHYLRKKSGTIAINESNERYYEGFVSVIVAMLTAVSVM